MNRLPLLFLCLLLAGCSSPPPREPFSWEELNRQSQRALELKAQPHSLIH